MADTGRSCGWKELCGKSKLMEKVFGFDMFWAELRSEIAVIEKDWDRIERQEIVESRGKSWRIDWIRFSSIGDMVIHGWIATPYDHPTNNTGILWMPGYSFGTPRPDDSNLVSGSVTLAINVHGNLPDAPYVSSAGKEEYILNGIDDPYQYIYRSIVGHCLCAMDVLEQQSEVTAGIVSAGMSQGGGLALIVAAQDRRANICCADMPFLSDIRTALTLSHSPAYRELKSYVKEHPRALDTVLMYDPLFHADLITVPVWISAGGKDPACRPKTVEAVYARIASHDKHYEFFPNAGHVFVPQMNAAYQRMIEQYLVRNISTPLEV
jgi:cephalosporin-C deacetylase